MQRRTTEKIVVDRLRELGYTAQGFYANSISFGLPQSRTRLYILGVDDRQCQVVHGPEQWRQWLEDLCHVVYTVYRTGIWSRWARLLRFDAGQNYQDVM